MDSRLAHFIKKEFLQLWRDPRLLFLALMAPVIQLIIFGYVASTDINHISTVVLDSDNSVYSRAYLQSYKNSGYFDFNYYVQSPAQLRSLIDGGRAKLGLCVPVDFGKKLVRGESAPVQAVIDGSNAATAGIIQGYINQINFGQAQAWLRRRLARAGLTVELQLLNLESRVWYNPDLKSVNYMVPGVFATILMMISMILTSASIIKEKERGTMEMLAVTPLRPTELILGKLIPFALVAFFDILLVFLAATLWFNIQFRGNVLELFLLGSVFMLTGLGLGVFLSIVSQTQRQAMMTTVFLIMPQIILSGFIFPIANMPWLIQLATGIIPLRYFLEIVRSIFLKGVGLRYLWHDVWPMVLIGAVIMGLSVLRFRKKLE
ncbi:MAG: ABC transporter permease [Candidatus Saganbacteria bacterium]|nr:ABC transporter permease [Candidatus Saganbacteria bacterium]